MLSERVDLAGAEFSEAPLVRELDPSSTKGIISITNTGAGAAGARGPTLTDLRREMFIGTRSQFLRFHPVQEIFSCLTAIILVQASPLSAVAPITKPSRRVRANHHSTPI